MTRTVTLSGRQVTYTLERKRVKNINLRVRTDGSVYVSARHGVAVSEIERFMLANTERILRAIDRVAAIKPDETDYNSKDINERCRVEFAAALEAIYPLFARYGIPYPVLKIRLLKSSWGICNTQTATVTLAKRLIGQPKAFIEYVVAHELAHLVVPNHSAAFRAVMDEVMPDWKQRRI